MPARQVGIRLWEVASLMGASALGSGNRRARDQTDQRVWIGNELLQPLTVALEPGVPPKGLPARAIERRRTLRAHRHLIEQIDLGSRLSERRTGGARSEHEAFGQRIRGQPVCAVQPGARALADGVQAGNRCPGVQVRRDPAHHVVRGRRHRNEFSLGVDPGATECADHVREQGLVDVAHVQVYGRSSGQRHLLLDGSGDLVAGGELVDKPLPGGVEQPRALAADCLGDEKAVAPVRRRDRRRMKLHELEIGEGSARAEGQQQSTAGRPGGVGRA